MLRDPVELRREAFFRPAAKFRRLLQIRRDAGQGIFRRVQRRQVQAVPPVADVLVQFRVFLVFHGRHVRLESVLQFLFRPVKRFRAELVLVKQQPHVFGTRGRHSFQFVFHDSEEFIRIRETHEFCSM